MDELLKIFEQRNQNKLDDFLINLKLFLNRSGNEVLTVDLAKHLLPYLTKVIYFFLYPLNSPYLT